MIINLAACKHNSMATVTLFYIFLGDDDFMGVELSAMSNCVILIDLERLNHKSSEDVVHQQNLMQLVFLNHHVILALSSAEGYYVNLSMAQSGYFREAIISAKAEFKHSVRFLPFSKSEYQLYKECAMSKFTFLSDQTVYEYTLNNPKLLNAIKDCKNEDEVVACIDNATLSTMLSLKESAL